jgi:hypothetical protein
LRGVRRRPWVGCNRVGARPQRAEPTIPRTVQIDAEHDSATLPDSDAWAHNMAAPGSANPPSRQRCGNFPNTARHGQSEPEARRIDHAPRAPSISDPERVRGLGEHLLAGLTEVAVERGTRRSAVAAAAERDRHLRDVDAARTAQAHARKCLPVIGLV